MMILQLVILTVCVAVGQAGIPLEHRTCTKISLENPPNGTNRLDMTVSFVGCEEAPCILERGGVYLLESNITFRSIDPKTNNLTFKGYIYPESLQIPIKYDDGKNFCNFIVHGTCNNYAAGAELHLRRSFKIDPIHQALKGWARMVFKDEKGVPQYCGEFRVVLQNTPDHCKPTTCSAVGIVPQYKGDLDSTG